MSMRIRADVKAHITRSVATATQQNAAALAVITNILQSDRITFGSVDDIKLKDVTPSVVRMLCLCLLEVYNTKPKFFP
jgi:hypothetical protein